MTKKKFVALLIVLTAVLIGLTGCGSEEKVESHIHDWSEENYQEPKACLECGKIEGKPIPPKFLSLERGFSEIGVPYTYKSCYEDKSDAARESYCKRRESYHW